MDADIVQNKDFEKAIVKILTNCETQLNKKESKEVSNMLQKGDIDVKKGTSTKISYYEQLEQKRRKLNTSVSQYKDCRFVPATSSSVERLFSVSRWILTGLRSRMSPILFESLLFLKLNRCLWDLKLVSAALKLKQDERYTVLDSDDFYNKS